MEKAEPKKQKWCFGFITFPHSTTSASIGQMTSTSKYSLSDLGPLPVVLYSGLTLDYPRILLPYSRDLLYRNMGLIGLKEVWALHFSNCKLETT